MIALIFCNWIMENLDVREIGTNIGNRNASFILFYFFLNWRKGVLTSYGGFCGLGFKKKKIKPKK